MVLVHSEPRSGEAVNAHGGSGGGRKREEVQFDGPRS